MHSQINENPGQEYVEVPVKGVRKVISERMLASLQTTAQLTLNSSADASYILEYRKRLKNAEQPELNKISINDIIHYAVVRTILKMKEVNAHFETTVIKQFERVHLGFAVDTPRGLMVPVIKNADRLSLKMLAQEAKRLGAACNQGTVLPDELNGATFTVTNLGAFGIESFTPVLNPPEICILGVCAIQTRPVIKEGQTEFVPHIGLSLTFNHQALDGAPAARFLKELARAIAHFDLLLTLTE